MYEVTITARAERELRRLDRSVKNRVVHAILALAANPRPAGCIKVKSEEGVSRVGYQIDDASSEVAVIRIGHRSEFYD